MSGVADSVGMGDEGGILPASQQCSLMRVWSQLVELAGCYDPLAYPSNLKVLHALLRMTLSKRHANASQPLQRTVGQFQIANLITTPDLASDMTGRGSKEHVVSDFLNFRRASVNKASPFARIFSRCRWLSRTPKTRDMQLITLLAEQRWRKQRAGTRRTE